MWWRTATLGLFACASTASALALDYDISGCPGAFYQSGNNTLAAADRTCSNSAEFLWATTNSSAADLRFLHQLHEHHIHHNSLPGPSIAGRKLEVFHFEGPPHLIFMCDFGTSPQEFALNQGDWKMRRCSCNGTAWDEGYCSAYKVRDANAPGKPGFVVLNTDDHAALTSTSDILESV